tara:strand:- start:295 stop:696 length:402 start_codon:yes stop_codon:yes gene_type:complete
MIYKFKTITSVYEKNACRYIDETDGEPKINDLMITFWQPINFKGIEKNFLLRKDHKLWDAFLTIELNRLKKVWLEDMGLEPKKHWVNELETVNGITSFKIYEHRFEYSDVWANPRDWEVLDSEEDKDTGVFLI